MKIFEITAPQLQTIQVAQAVMPDGSVANVDNDPSKKDTGTVFTDKDGNLGVAEPGKPLEPGQAAATDDMIKDPKKLQQTMAAQARDNAKKQADQAMQPAQKTTGTTGTTGTK
tara:strand:+ start:1573 stop:1911 length:339 start_codon:yes stop_codon:yes gene_type:complete